MPTAAEMVTTTSTSFVGPLDSFVQYRYTISELYFIIDGYASEFPVERIVDFKIENYFDEASFPLFKLNLVMEASRYYEIVRNKENVKIKLRMQSYYITDANEEKKSLLVDVFNDTFSIFLEDDNSDYQEDLKREAGTLDDTNVLNKLSNNIELFLFKDSTVTGLRSTINTVLNGVSMCTAVTYLLHKANASHVLMSPFENTAVYSNVLLPPQSIEKQIRLLNNSYGFYKKGGVVFFGLFHSYILNCKEGCTAWYKDEWTEVCIYVLDKSTNQSYLDGVVHKFKQEKYYFTVKTEGIDISNKSVTSNVLTGTNATVIDMANNKTTQKNSGAVTKGSANSAIVFNNSSNPYMAETYSAQQYMDSTVVSLVIENGTLEAFNPNKTFSIIFENATQNQKYKGTYRISSAIHTFSKSGDSYTLITAIVLKRVSA